ncbi:MAG: hypothetical protein ABI923_04300 [bacterium]
MKRLMMTMALTCVLSSSSLAGDIPSGGFTAPPPPPSAPTAPGEVPTVGYAPQMSEAAFDLVEWLLSSVI